MEFGIGYFPTHDAVKPGAFARLVEDRGHESLFFAEHTHIPAIAHWIPSANLSVVETALERWEAAIAQLNGES